MLDSTSIQVPNPAESTDNPSAPVTTGNVFNAMATYIQHASPGERAALARLNPDQTLRPHEIAALARALLAPSDALALDEPFTGLDADNRAAAQRCVARAAREKIVLLVSHEDDALAGAEVRLQ